jgi:hypothetical protein
MAYYVFDLDETLANTYTPFYMLCGLRPERVADSEKIVITPELRSVLDKAYRVFVRLVSASEISNKPLGILQPGIINAFHVIQEQRAVGLCSNVVIYSNNGSLAMLEFIRDILRSVMGDGLLISDCSHWGDPRRASEIEPGNPGAGKKTWAVLSEIMKRGPTAAPETLAPEDVVFFDDQIHEDLLATLGPIEHYIHVKPYTYRASIHTMLALYKTALTKAGLFKSPILLEEFQRVVEPLCSKAQTFLEHMRNMVLNTPKTSTNKATPPPSDSAHRIKDAIQRMSDEMYVRTLRGGFRTRARKSRKTTTRKARLFRLLRIKTRKETV